MGGREIAAAQLLEYERALPDRLKSPAEPAEARREYLTALIDRELMLLAARSQAMEQRADIGQEVEGLVTAKLIDRIVQEKITDTVEVTEEELRREYEDLQMGWLHWPAHILSATQEDAREVRRLLDQGADFASLARERSLADDRERGGELRSWFGHNDVVPAIGDVVYELPAGSITEPIHTRDGWEIIKILDRRRLPYEQLRSEAYSLVQRVKWLARRKEYLAELKERYGAEYHGETAEAVLEGLRRGGDGPVDADQYVASYSGGGLRVSAAIAAVGGLKRGPEPADSLSLFQTLDRWIIPDSLMAKAAREAGMDRDPELLAWRQQRLEELMVRALRDGYLAGRTDASEAATRAYYEEIKDRYSFTGDAYITEVLLDSEQEALEVLEAARSGVPLEELAVTRSVRSRAEGDDLHMHRDERGRMLIDPMRGSPYHGLLDTPESQEVGRLQGPVQMEGRWAVFRVEEPIEPYYIPYEKVRRPVAFQLRKREAGRLFKVFIDSLRGAYADDVIRYDVDLAALE